jgi:prolyl oligopeptidase
MLVFFWLGQVDNTPTVSAPKGCLNVNRIAARLAVISVTAFHPASAQQHPIAADAFHGVTVADPYRWLEDGAAAEVTQWVTEQNERTRKYLDALPGRTAIANELIRVAKATATYDAFVRQTGGRLFALTFNPGAQQPQLVTLSLSGDPNSRKVILDPARLATDGSVAMDFFEPSPDGRLVAVSLSLNGSEDGTLHVFETNSGRETGAPIGHVQYPTAGGSVAWNPASTGFWYTRYPGNSVPEAERHFNQQVYYHELSKDSASDRLVLAVADGLPRTAEIFLDNRYGHRSALASVQLGDGGDWQHFILSPTAAQRVAGYEEKIKAAVLAADGAFFGISIKDAANGKLVRLLPPYRQGTLRTIVGETTQALTTEANNRAIAISGRRLFVGAVDGGPTVIKSFDFNGKSPLLLASPPVSTAAAFEAMPGGDLLYRVRSYLAPSRSMLWQSRTGRSVETPLRIQTPLDLSGFEVRRLFAISKDGTPVPMSVITRKGFVPDGSAPLMLYAYGGYGINQSPGFIGTEWYLLLKGGSSVAIGNIRGGGEYGDRWHREGMLTRKQNVFDDFAAVAQHLITQKYTNSKRLALTGASNGGLLMGAVLTQHPDLARAVVSEVGIYDMLRFEIDPNGSFNTTEFGSVKDAEQFRALLAYSPQQHVKEGQQYPAIFLSAGDNDGRVNPLHSRKFAAALQASGTQRPVYLRTSAKSGHGIGSSLDETVALNADITAFLFDQLGLDWKAVR